MLLNETGKKLLDMSSGYTIGTNPGGTYLHICYSYIEIVKFP